MVLLDGGDLSGHWWTLSALQQRRPPGNSWLLFRPSSLGRLANLDTKSRRPKRLVMPIALQFVTTHQLAGNRGRSSRLRQKTSLYQADPLPRTILLTGR